MSGEKIERKRKIWIVRVRIYDEPPVDADFFTEEELEHDVLYALSQSLEKIWRGVTVDSAFAEEELQLDEEGEEEE